MRDLGHAVGRHMPAHDVEDIWPIPDDQVGKSVGFTLQDPVDNLRIIGHERLHSWDPD